MKGSDKLGQGCELNVRGNTQPYESAPTKAGRNLDHPRLWNIAEIELAKDVHHPKCDPNKTKVSTLPCSSLSGKSCNGGNAAETRDQRGHRFYGRNLRAPESKQGAVDPHGEKQRKSIEEAVIRRIGCTPEHIQHAASHEKASGNVDGRDEGGYSGAVSNPVSWEGPPIHELQATNCCHTADCIGNRHQGRVQSWNHSPYYLPADQARESKGSEHLAHIATRARL
mmetsp:Transcript_9944/g.13518  ORF Transcript_9944/g.13518 Transcript_9944/m.13518 type:complete len:225 (+) Transcript_9944:1278-1952(+)